MQMRMVGSFGVFRRAVHMMRRAGSDCNRVVRTALRRLHLEGLTRRALQIQKRKREGETAGHAEHLQWVLWALAVGSLEHSQGYSECSHRAGRLAH